MQRKSEEEEEDTRSHIQKLDAEEQREHEELEAKRSAFLEHLSESDRVIRVRQLRIAAPILHDRNERSPSCKCCLPCRHITIG